MQDNLNTTDPQEMPQQSAPPQEQQSAPAQEPAAPPAPQQNFDPYTGKPQTSSAYSYAPYGYTGPKPERSGIAEIRETAHTVRGIILVAALFFMSMFIIESIGFGGLGLSVPMITAVFYIIAFWWFADKEKPMRRFDIFMTVPIFLIAASFFFNISGISRLIGVLALLVLVPLHIASISGVLPDGMLSGNIFAGFGHTVACSFTYADVPVTTLFKNRKTEKGKRAGPVIIGMLVGIPLALIFLCLYYAVDDIFKQFVNNIIEKLGISVGHIVADIIFGFVLCLLAGGWLFAFKRLKSKDGMKAEDMQKLDGTIVGTVFALVAVVQVLFVYIQLRYLFADSGNMPGGMDYADYARKGFFELTFTILISIAIIMLAIAIMRRDEKGRINLLPRISLSICILANYIIVASSVKRFMIYIDGYDLSVKRVACLWLIVIMALSFLACLIKLWVPKFKSLRYIALVMVVMVAVLGFMNIEGAVADYNVSRYIDSGCESEIDMQYLSELGPGAAPALARLVDEKTPNSDLAKSCLNQIRYQNLEKTSWRNLTLVAVRADGIYERLGIKEDYTDESYDSEYGHEWYGYDEYGYDRLGIDKYGYNRSQIGEDYPRIDYDKQTDWDYTSSQPEYSQEEYNWGDVSSTLIGDYY